MFSLIRTRINGWVNNGNGEAGDLRRYRAHYDVIVMQSLGTRDRKRGQLFCDPSESPPFLSKLTSQLNPKS